MDESTQRQRIANGFVNANSHGGEVRSVTTASATSQSLAQSSSDADRNRPSTAAVNRGTASIAVQTDTLSDMNMRLPLWSLSLTPFNASPPNASEVDDHTVATWLSQVKFANESETSSSDSQPPKPRKPFPLYSDVVQVVLRYLNINNLLSAIQLSKLWYHSLNTAHSLGLTSNLSPDRLSYMPARTAIGRHISGATNLTSAIECSQNQIYPGFNILPHLSMLLPNLTSLRLHLNSFRMDLPRVGVNWLPPFLNSLTLVINSDLNCPSLIAAVGQLKHLQDLSVLGTRHLVHGVDFSPLQEIKHLERMTVGSQPVKQLFGKYTSSLIKFVQQTRISSLSLLSTVTVRSDPSISDVLDRESSDLAFPLMESGCLTSICATINPALLQSLVNYPSVTKLTACSIDLDVKEMHLLDSFKRITELNVPAPSPMITTCDSIVSICQRLQQLRTVRVPLVGFNSSDMNALLSQLPFLTELELTASTSNSNSLAPLSSFGLPTRLKKLSLKNYFAFAKDLISYILPLQELEYLRLEDVCTTLIPETTKEQLRNLPKLKECILREGAVLLHTRRRVPNLTSPEEVDQYVPNSNQKGTHTLLFTPCVEETTTRNLESNQYSFVYETFHSISGMKEYRHKSVEELRLEDEEIGLENPPPLHETPVSLGHGPAVSAGGASTGAFLAPGGFTFGATPTGSFGVIPTAPPPPPAFNFGSQSRFTPAVNLPYAMVSNPTRAPTTSMFGATNSFSTNARSSGLEFRGSDASDDDSDNSPPTFPWGSNLSTHPTNSNSMRNFRGFPATPTQPAALGGFGGFAAEPSSAAGFAATGFGSMVTNNGSGFSFGSSAPLTNNAGGFTFGSTAPAANNAGDFTFGSNVPVGEFSVESAAPATNEGGGFAFGSTAPSTNNMDGFTFGSTASSTSTSTSNRFESRSDCKQQ